MNNTNNTCPPKGLNNIILITDNRPSKSLYTNINDSNKFRKHLQENGDKILETYRMSFNGRMNCNPEMSHKPSGGNLEPYAGGK